jgi:hypothetical protein
LSEPAGGLDTQSASTNLNMNGPAMIGVQDFPNNQNPLTAVDLEMTQIPNNPEGILIMVLLTI